MRDRALGATIRIYFTTHTLSTGVVVAPSSAFVNTDFKIYKDGSSAEKTTTNGITVTSPFDSQIGAHLLEIDTSNATGDIGFWASGSSYRVVLSTAKTVDSKDPSGVCVGEFSLELQTADVRKLGGDAQSATDLKDFADAGYDPSTNKVQGVVLVDTTTTNTDIGIGGAGLNAIPWNPSWDTEVQSEVADALAAFGWGSITVGSVSGSVGSVAGGVSVSAIGNDVITAASIAANAITEIQFGLGTIANQTSIASAIADIQTEVDKIPRLGETFKHRQIASSAVAKSADVIIEAAP